MQTLTLDAPAKINLYLQIKHRRPDGYHEIETIFQKLTLADTLTCTRKPDGAPPLELETPQNIDLGPPEKNLITQAWRHATREKGNTPFPVYIRLQKNIPAGGGLGGGSSNAAATFRAYSQWKQIPIQQITRAATLLGADIPFFLQTNSCAIGTGIGEILQPLPHQAKWRVVLAFPPYGIPTAKAYARFDPQASSSQNKIENLILAIKGQDIQKTLAHLHNNMEPLAFAIRPELARLRDDLESKANQPVRMTGSGSTLFTLAADNAKAQAIAAAWKTIPSIHIATTAFA